MLDQRLLRDNPDLISQQLARRNMTVDLSGLQQIARQGRDLEEERSNLQAEGNRIGKEVGLKIKAGASANGPEVQTLRDAGNRIKHQVAALEEQEKGLETQLREQLLTGSLHTHLERRHAGTGQLRHLLIAQLLHVLEEERLPQVGGERAERPLDPPELRPLGVHRGRR